MDNRKYLKDGRAVQLVQVLENGKFLVQPLYFVDGYEDEDEDGFVDDSAPIIVDKLFDRAPLELYDSEVTQRQAELNRLNGEITKASAEQRMIERENAERLTRLKKFEPLKELESLIESGYTHTVDFDGCTIGRIKEAAADRDREFPMLTLHGALRWDRVPYWTISVGKHGVIIPCTSLEQAQGIVRANVEKALRNGDMNRATSEVVRVADKMGIPVPMAYRKRVLQINLEALSSNTQWRINQAASAAEELRRHNEYIDTAKAQLDALNNPVPVAPVSIADDELDPF